MPNIRHIPQVRFKGFDDAWEQRKLYKLADFRRGLTYSPSDISSNGIRVLRSSNILEDTFIISADDVFVKPSAVNIPYAESGDILITSANGSSRLVGKHAIVFCAQGMMVHGGFMLLAHPYDNSSFVNALMSAPWYANFINTYIAGGNGAIGNLNKSDLENQDVLVPCDQEKRKIGTFFLALDDLITLHQQKYDKLVNLKAAMLEKMFPKDSADVPEVRFHGFADAWEQCKLGSVYVERNERGNKNLPILSVSIHTGISNGELSRDDLGKQVRRSEDKSLYKHVMAGDLVFNMMRAWQGAIGVSSVEGMVSPAYITAASTCKLDSDFMDYTVKRKDIVNQIDNLSYGVTDFRKRLYWDSFVRVFCYFPEEPEQNKIGAFFRSLDDLITLHKRKLEKLRNIKQACLEKMFIS